jgi:DcuC family C4-dicarboxylate transporter
MILALGLLVIAVTVYALLRRVDVRLALLLASLVLGALAGDLAGIVRTFLVTLTNEQFVLPLCTAMGFAHVLRYTGCDQHLVRLLVRPLQRVRFLLIPGGVVVGFLVNIPVVSQTSTAVVVGTVLVPVLLAARVSPVTTGAALLLGSSLGGELLNPGAPELRTVTTTVHVETATCVAHIAPLLLLQLGLATAVFWLVSYRDVRDLEPEETKSSNEEAAALPEWRVSWVKAIVPMVPLVLLFLTSAPLRVVEVPRHWLVGPDESGARFDSRLIGAAMLVGIAAAALVSPRSLGGTAAAFFEGTGYTFTHIISLIVVAQCFGKGVERIGLAALLGDLIAGRLALLIPMAGAFPMAFAWTCGSGMATTQSVFEFFVAPAREAGINPVHVGAVVSIAAAAGRTLSPVAAVTLMSASLTGTTPFQLTRRLALPLLVSTAGVVIFALVLPANEAEGASGGQALGHFPLNVGQLLRAHRQADQAVRDALPTFLRGADVAVRGRGRVAARRGRVAERGTEGDAGGRAHEGVDAFPVAAHLEAEHVAEAALELPAGQGMVGVVRPSRVDDPAHRGLLHEPVGQGKGVGGGLPHAQAERAEPPAGQPAVERVGGEAPGGDHGQHRRPEVAAAAEEPERDVAVTADHLRQALHDQVSPVIERPHQDRRRERVVYHQQTAALPGQLAQGLHIDQAQERVGKRLHEQELGRLFESRPYLVEVSGVHECGLDAEAVQLGLQELRRPAVEAIAGDDAVALLQGSQ